MRLLQRQTNESDLQGSPMRNSRSEQIIENLVYSAGWFLILTPAFAAVSVILIVMMWWAGMFLAVVVFGPFYVLLVAGASQSKMHGTGVPWLLVLFVLGTASSIGIMSFQSTLSYWVILIPCSPWFSIVPANVLRIFFTSDEVNRSDARNIICGNSEVASS